MVHKIWSAWIKVKGLINPIFLTAVGILFFILGIKDDKWETAFSGSCFALMGVINVKISWDTAHLPTSGPEDEEEFEHEEN